jgi:hypothetical protein
MMQCARMRTLTLVILVLITIGGWGAGILIGMLGKSAIHEILSAVYFLIGTVAFAASAIIGQLGMKQLRQIVHESLRTNELLGRMAPASTEPRSRESEPPA